MTDVLTSIISSAECSFTCCSWLQSGNTPEFCHIARIMTSAFEST